MGLPFQPESDEALRARFWRALETVWDFTNDDPAKTPRPGEDRRQVFDFECGARLIISRDRITAGGVVELHLSAGLRQFGVTHEMFRQDPATALARGVGEAVAHLLRITDELPPFSEAAVSEGGVLHLRAFQLPDGSFAGPPAVVDATGHLALRGTPRGTVH